MKIAVMGTGGMGGYYGGLLAEAGEDVTFIARGGHFDAIKQNGLTLIGDTTTHKNFRVAVTNCCTEMDFVDVVLFCVKLYDIESAANQIRPLVGPDTMVISVLNGVDGPERIENVIGPGHTIGGAAYASAMIDEPGVIRFKSTGGRLKIGELDGSFSSRLKAFKTICDNTEFECELTDNIVGGLWEKFILLATNSGLSCLCRRPVGEIYNDPDLLGLAKELMAEVRTLAIRKGISIDPNIIDKSVAWSQSLPPDLYASMYHDLVAGKRMEVEGMSGHVIQLGRELGVKTPHHLTVYGGLKVLKGGI